ncbi:MAG: hypothetical protein HOE30_10440 [Deltaproteobacteria bacterium]|nr:hypothetical protein [Deltaproteobacteria bacterium]
MLELDIIEYKGYTYTEEIFEDEDTRKIWHTFRGPDGAEIKIDISPYTVVTNEMFKVWVDDLAPAWTRREWNQLYLQVTGL